LEIFKESRSRASRKLSRPPKHDFAFPIYTQRRSNIGITVTCPDMNITRTLPLPQHYEDISDFYKDYVTTLIEVDSLAVEEFKKRDEKTELSHRKTLFPRGLKDHLEVDLQKLRFKPPQAALLTTKSTRTWQRWCQQKTCKRRSNGLKFERRHYLIPFSEIEPFLRAEFIENPGKIVRLAVANG